MTSSAIPYNGCFSLIRDADRRDLFGLNLGFCQHCGDGARLRAPDLIRIMFYPSGLRIILFEFLLGDADDLTPLIDQEGSAAGGALIKGKYVAIGHDDLDGQVR
jgi:hypothetical protein